MKIRKGNDIRLRIRLPYTSSESVSPVNIQTARAYFVNTTLKNLAEADLNRKTRFIGRFPIEPFVDEFQPNRYNINSVGNPIYKAFVANRYNGFGYKPNWKESFPIKEINLTTYQAKVERTEDPDVIVVTFPAEALLYTGVYELIIVSLIFDEGYENNVRTVTANQKNVFEIVADSEDADATDSVQLEIENTSYSNNNDVYIVSGSYSNNRILLNRNDGRQIPVDVSSINGWYVED